MVSRWLTPLNGSVVCFTSVQGMQSGFADVVSTTKPSTNLLSSSFCRPVYPMWPYLLCQVSQLCVHSVVCSTCGIGRLSLLFGGCQMLTSNLYRLFVIFFPCATCLPFRVISESVPLQPRYHWPSVSHRPSERRLFLFVGICSTSLKVSMYVWFLHFEINCTVALPYACVMMSPTPATVVPCSVS